MGENVKARAQGEPRSPLHWVDLAKGICIILVVMMHSALGVELRPGDTSFVHAVVGWTKPFRMPDFFLLSGFLAAGIVRLDWRAFLDRRVLHYLYFYVLWLVIVLAVKAAALGITAPSAFAMAVLKGLIEPFSTLWFIYILPAFMLVARAARGRAALPVLAVALFLHLFAARYLSGGDYALSAEMTPSTAFDSFTLFLIFFLAGYLGAAWIGGIAAWAMRQPKGALALLAVWAAFHTLLLAKGVAGAPFMPLLLGLAGAVAVTTFAALMTRLPLTGWLRYCGRHSLAIYLAFVIPMAITREGLERLAPWLHPGWIAFSAMLAGILGPLLIERLAVRTGLGFLFIRPVWARLRAL
ncbi:MAG: acyltransferase family protein [Proteobacteria bacterium]|nr:acyltransferase family protein [Pseudomonadota bacterium]